MLFRAEKIETPRLNSGSDHWNLSICDYSGLPVAGCLVPPLVVDSIVSFENSEIPISAGSEIPPSNIKFYQCSSYSITEDDKSITISLYR